MNGEAIKIVVCDDDVNRVDNWAAQIGESLSGHGPSPIDVNPLRPADFAVAVGALAKRLRDAKAGEGPDEEDGAHVVDTADVLILDSDLTPDPGSNQGDDPNDAVDEYLVGEVGSDVAKLARTHSRAGAIMLVNQSFKRRTFDLTLMRGTNGPADVYVSFEDVANARLWLGNAGDSYRPWSWPRLISLPATIHAALSAHELGHSLHDVLGLSRATLDDGLTPRQQEALSPESEQISSMTLRDVALSPTFGAGYGPNESLLPDDDLLRSGLSGLRRWLERAVLPTQNVLIDLPHLLQNRPWLSSSRGDAVSLSDSAEWWAESQPSILPEAYNATASNFLGRTVYEVERLPVPSAGERLKIDDPVFCEDISAFKPADQARSFTSDIEGSYGSRFVAKIAGVDYIPPRRLY